MKKKVSLEALKVSSFATSDISNINAKGGGASERSLCGDKNSGCQACNEPTYWC